MTPERAACVAAECLRAWRVRTLRQSDVSAPKGLLQRGLAFVDIETTGGSSQRESITEIGIVELDESGVREWSSLVRPEMPIPAHIERLTGISNRMIADAPRFADLADTVFDRLEGRVFIAHNARFDHAHLRAAFRRTGMDIRPRVLCTVKLSRRLYPACRGHSLDALIARHGLQVRDRHRALGDAQALLQFWMMLNEHFPSGQVEEAVRTIIGHPSLPSQLDQGQLEGLPDGPGVYLFYGDTAMPLYVGKSTRLRSRVLSHFCADHRGERELSLSQQVRRIEWLETSGELGALLKEAQLIKQLQPSHNRLLRRHRDLCAWRLGTDLLGDPRLELAQGEMLDPGQQDNLFGIFRSRREATARLQALAREHGLCPPLLGLGRPAGEGRRCFDFQLKRCAGACAGVESSAVHGQRLRHALSALKLQSWPFPGPVGLREGRSLHVIDGWRYLGSCEDEGSLEQLLRSARPGFDLDIYRLLVKAVGRFEAVELAPGDSARREMVATAAEVGRRELA